MALRAANERTKLLETMVKRAKSVAPFLLVLVDGDNCFVSPWSYVSCSDAKANEFKQEFFQDVSEGRYRAIEALLDEVRALARTLDLEDYGGHAEIIVSIFLNLSGAAGVLFIQHKRSLRPYLGLLYRLGTAMREHRCCGCGRRTSSHGREDSR